jgi:hypothetical protein
MACWKSMYETFLSDTVGSGLFSFVLYTRKKISAESPIFTQMIGQFCVYNKIILES